MARIVTVLAWLLSVAAAACSSLPPPEPRPLSDDEAAMVRRATEAVDLLRPDAAAVVGELLARFPGSVDGLRLEQVLRSLRGEDWRLLEEARVRRRAAPESATARYLLVRTIPDREVQARRFRHCVDLDPSFFFGAFGLAAAELARGRADAAEEWAARALAIRPRDPDARCIAIAARSAQGAGDEAAEAWRALLREEPGWPRAVTGAADFFAGRGEGVEAAETLLSGLRRHPGAGPFAIGLAGVVEEHALPADALREGAALAGRTTAGCLLSAAVHRAQGDARSSLADLDEAISRDASPRLLSEDLFASAVLAGDYVRAREVLEGALPGLALDPLNLRRSAVSDLLAGLASAATAPGDAGVLADLARALSATGHADLAATVASVSLALAPGDDRRVELTADLVAWCRFLSSLRERIESGYGREARDEGGDDLAEVVESVRRDSCRLLGRDVLSEVEELEVPFAGSILRTDRARDWLDHGTLLVVGRRAGGPVEAKLMRITAIFRDRPLGESEYDLVVGEGDRIASFRERSGDLIGGFALPGLVVLDMGVARGLSEEARRLGAGGGNGELWPAEGPRRASLWFPGPVRAELLRRCRGADLDAVLSFILTHEEGHLVDVERFLPVAWNLPAILWELFACGFSARAVEEGLEERAEIHSLVNGADRRLSLASTLSLVDGGGSSVHAAAYRRVVARLVDEVLSEPARYPSVDTRFNVLQQLGRLTDEELDRLVSTLRQGSPGRGVVSSARGRGRR